MRSPIIAFFFGLALLGIIPSRLSAQAPLAGPRSAPAVVAWPGWEAAALPRLPGVGVSASRADRSAAKVIAIHTAVGTGAGLVIGLLLSGASVDDDRTSVVLTWTALGAAAGVVSGVVTWLVGRPL